MASLNQLTSEIANSLGQPNNHVLKENIKHSIIHTRNELIRRSYENHAYIDKGLMQRYKVTLENCTDGDIELLFDNDIGEDLIDELKETVGTIKRTINLVPRPVRLTNNLPFARVSTAGFKYNREFPFIKETSARFRSNVPGLCGMPAYDYINERIYIFPADGKELTINAIVLEAPFEYPTPIAIENGTADEWDAINGDDEFLLPEDMIGQIKDIIYKRDLLQTIRETNETSNIIKY